jgi:hypothetical protein
MNFVVIAKTCMAADDNVCAKHVASTEDYVPTNLAIRANVAAVTNYSTRFDYRRGMNNGWHDALCKSVVIRLVAQDHAYRHADHRVIDS